MVYFMKKYFKRNITNVSLLSLMLIIGWFLSIINPILFSKYINLLVYGTNLFYIKKFIAIFALVSIGNIMISYIINICMAKVQTKMAFQLNYDVLEHVKKVPLLEINRYNPVYLNERINSDSNIIISFCLSNYLNVIVKFIAMVFSGYMLYSINFKLSLILLCFMPIYVFIYLLLRRPLYKLNLETKNSQNTFFAKLTEQIINIKSIKLNSSFELYNSSVIIAFKNMFKILLNYTRVSYIFSALDTLVGSIASVMIFFLGGIKVVQGEISIGEFTMINTYFTMIINSISYYLAIGKSYQDAKASHIRIKEILDKPKENNGYNLIDDIREINLKNITFYYKDKLILKEFNYNFKRGNIYCIKGSNGVGKSTLINIIVGIFKPINSGSIRYNKININKIDMYEVRRNLISIVPQDFKLSDIEIEDLICNIKSNKNNDVINELKEDINTETLLDILNIYFESKQENKFNNFSGGENQKIAIFRSLLKDPEVLILDEPTSALDKEHVILLERFLKKIKKDKIIILITHNKDIIHIADNIIDLNENLDLINKDNSSLQTTIYYHE